MSSSTSSNFIEVFVEGPELEVEDGIFEQEHIKVKIPITGGKYADKVSTLTRDQAELLKQWIKDAKKLHIPISINRQGDVLDGHHRLRFCCELGIKPTFELKEFPNELEEELYVYRINRARRQLTKFQNIELHCKSSR
jgi:hypothetical protein